MDPVYSDCFQALYQFAQEHYPWITEDLLQQGMVEMYPNTFFFLYHTDIYWIQLRVIWEKKDLDIESINSETWPQVISLHERERTLF